MGKKSKRTTRNKVGKESWNNGNDGRGIEDGGAVPPVVGGGGVADGARDRRDGWDEAKIAKAKILSAKIAAELARRRATCAAAAAPSNEDASEDETASLAAACEHGKSLRDGVTDERADQDDAAAQWARAVCDNSLHSGTIEDEEHGAAALVQRMKEEGRPIASTTLDGAEEERQIVALEAQQMADAEKRIADAEKEERSMASEEAAAFGTPTKLLDEYAELVADQEEEDRSSEATNEPQRPLTAAEKKLQDVQEAFTPFHLRSKLHDMGLDTEVLKSHKDLAWAYVYLLQKKAQALMAEPAESEMPPLIPAIDPPKTGTWVLLPSSKEGTLFELTYAFSDGAGTIQRSDTLATFLSKPLLIPAARRAVCGFTTKMRTVSTRWIKCATSI